MTKLDAEYQVTSKIGVMKNGKIYTSMTEEIFANT